MTDELKETDVSKYLLFIVPGYSNDLVSLEEKVYGSIYQIGSRDHREFCKEFVEKYFIDKSITGESHIDYARKFNKEGMIIGFNSGVKIGGLYTCTLFLPENLTDYQRAFLDSQKEVFASKFHQSENMFSTVIYTRGDVPYTGQIKGYRDLKIEAYINKNPNINNGYLLLYDYLDSLKKERTK